MTLSTETVFESKLKNVWYACSSGDFLLVFLINKMQFPCQGYKICELRMWKKRTELETKKKFNLMTN